MIYPTIRSFDYEQRKSKKRNTRTLWKRSYTKTFVKKRKSYVVKGIKIKSYNHKKSSLSGPIPTPFIGMPTYFSTSLTKYFAFGVSSPFSTA